MPHPARKRLIILGLKAAVSASILGGIFYFLPTEDFFEAFKQVSWSVWFWITLLYLARHLVSALKWWILLGSDTSVPLLKTIRAYFWGLFTNLYLPGVAGGDIVRAGLVARNTNQKTRIIVRSMADRLIDIASLLVVALGGALMLLDEDLSALTLIAKITVGLVPLSILGFWLIRPLVKFLEGLPVFLAKDKVIRAIISVEELKKRPFTLFIAFVVSVIGQAVFVALNIILGRECGIEMNEAAWYFAWPLAKLLAIAPISIAGLGVREGGLVALLSRFGANGAQVVAAGLLWQTVVFAGGFLSGVIALILDGLSVRRLKAAAASKDDLADLEEVDSPERVEILMYHSISEQPGVTSISPETFSAHLDALESEGYSVVSLKEVADWRNGKAQLPPKTAVLTFDDGFQDFADNAFPLIKAKGWSATVFLPTRWMGEAETWYGANETSRPLMSWEAVKCMHEGGIDFAGHTLTHPNLSRLSDEEVEKEVRGSIDAIEEKLGMRLPLFAPPYGRTSRSVRSILARHCELSVGTELASAKIHSDPMDMPRIEMHYFRNPSIWRSYLSGEGEFYFRFRAIMRKVRLFVLGFVKADIPARLETSISKD